MTANKPLTLANLMLTDEERHKLHGCRDTDKCISSTYCESQCNLEGERAAIIKAVKVLDNKGMLYHAADYWQLGEGCTVSCPACALLKEVSNG